MNLKLTKVLRREVLCSFRQFPYAKKRNVSIALCYFSDGHFLVTQYKGLEKKIKEYIQDNDVS